MPFLDGIRERRMGVDINWDRSSYVLRKLDIGKDKPGELKSLQ
jgi:hypothetical protein